MNPFAVFILFISFLYFLGFLVWLINGEFNREFDLMLAPESKKTEDAEAPSEAVVEPVKYLFVYGTLQRDEPTAWLLALTKAEFLTTGNIPSKLYDCGLFPGVRVWTGYGGYPTHGEVYLLPKDYDWRHLDAYEGVAPEDVDGEGAFSRRLCMAKFESGEEKQVWIYELTRVPLGAPEIESGIWSSV